MPRPSRTIYLVRRVQLSIQARLEEQLSPFGLTPTQYTVLSLSDRTGEGRAGEGLSSAQLSRRAGVSSQSMNEVVAALERKGLIAREEAPENRRILRARLTPEGRQLLARCNAMVDRFESALLGALSETELGTLRGLLERLMPDREEGS